MPHILGVGVFITQKFAILQAILYCMIKTRCGVPTRDLALYALKICKRQYIGPLFEFFCLLPLRLSNSSFFQGSMICSTTLLGDWTRPSSVGQCYSQGFCLLPIVLSNSSFLQQERTWKLDKAKIHTQRLGILLVSRASIPNKFNLLPHLVGVGQPDLAQDLTSLSAHWDTKQGN